MAAASTVPQPQQPATSRRFERTIGKIWETLQGDPSCLPSLMGTILKRHEEKFYQVLKWFKPPSRSSKEVVLSGKIGYRGKTLEVDRNQRDFILQISELLHLDEQMSFALFQSFIRSEVKGRHVEFSEATLNAVLAFYYEERLNVIRCVSTIVRYAESEDYMYYEQIRELIDRKICGGTTGEEARKKLSEYANAILQQYKDKSEEKPPDSLNKEQTERWATQCVSEQVCLLEILLQLYYAQLSPAPPDVFRSFIDTFKKQGFGTRLNAVGYLNAAGRHKARQVSYLSVLCCLAALNLENFAEDIDSRTKHWISKAGIDVLEKEFLSPQWGSIEPQGPILLAWAALSCRINQFTQGDELQVSTHAQKAMSCKAVPFLTQMLSDGFPLDDPSLLAYKQLVRGLLSVMLTAFDVDTLPIEDTIALYNVVYTANVPACREFWKVDRLKPTQSALLQYAQQQWPLAFGPLLTLLTALSPDDRCASSAFVSLAKMTSYKCIVDGLVLSSVADPIDTREAAGVASLLVSASVTQSAMQTSSLFVQLRSPLTVDGGVLTLPVGTKGRVSAVISGSQSTVSAVSSNFGSNPYYNSAIAQSQEDMKYIIDWEVRYSGWQVAFYVLDSLIQRLTTQSYPVPQDLADRATNVLALMDALFKHEATPVNALQIHLSELHGGQASATHAILPRLISLFQACAFVPAPPVTLLHYCLECIHGVARNNPGLVWNLLKRANLLDGAESEFQVSQGGAIRHLLVTVECLQGTYPITISFLKLLNTLLVYLQAWHGVGSPSLKASGFPAPPNASSAFINSAMDVDVPEENYQPSVEEFLPCLMYIQTAIFSFYETWRYTNITERWKIGCHVMTIFSHVLYDVSTPAIKLAIGATTLKDRLLYAILSDASFYQNLLNIVSVGPKTLEVYRKKLKASQSILEELVETGCLVLLRVLLLKKAHPENWWQIPTPLEHAISNKRFTKESNNLIYLIASYILYHHHDQISVTSTELLTLLCSAPIGLAPSATAATATPQTPSATTGAAARTTTSIVGYFGSQAESLRGEFLWRLSGKTENVYLRLAILRLLVNALESQPGLAELFVNIRTYATGTPKPAIDLDAAPNSCIDVVLPVLADQEWYLKEQPQVFAEVLSFLHALWKAAPEQHSVISHALEQKKDFWILLTKCLESDPYAASDKPEALCYGLIARANILRILALEVFYIPINGNVDKSLMDQIEKYKANPNQLFERCTKCSFNPDLKQNLATLASELGIDISDCTTVEDQRYYGAAFYYDTILINKKLENHLPKQGVKRMGANQANEAKVKQFLELVRKVNIEMSLVDAQLATTKAWATFLQTIVLRRDKTQSFDKAGEGMMVGLMMNMAKRLDLEKREGPAISLLQNEISATLLMLTKKWIASLDLQGRPGDHRATIVSVAEYLVSGLKKARSAVAVSSTLVSRLLTTLLLLFESLKSFGKDRKLTDVVLAVLPDVLECMNNGDSTLQAVCLSILEIITRRLESEATPLLAPALMQYDTIGSLLALMAEAIQTASVASSSSTTTTSPSKGSAEAKTAAAAAPQTTLATLSEPATRVEVILHTFLALIQGDIERKAANQQQSGLGKAPVSAAAPSTPGGPSTTSTPSTPARTPSKSASLALSSTLVHSDTVTSESLAIGGLARILSSEGFANFIREGLSFHNSKDERNPWHKVWCLSLSLVTKVLQVLGYEENFVDQVLNFVMAHNARLLHILQLEKTAPTEPTVVTAQGFGGKAPTESYPFLCLSQLDELERTTSLLFQLAQYRHRWRYILDSPYSRESLSTTLEKQVLYTMQQVIELIQKGSSLLSTMKQVSTTERKMSLEQFLRTTEHMLLLIMRNVVCFVRKISPNMFTEKHQNLDPESFEPIFAPLQAESSASAASVDLSSVPSGKGGNILQLSTTNLQASSVGIGTSQNLRSSAQPMATPAIGAAKPAPASATHVVPRLGKLVFFYGHSSHAVHKLLSSSPLESSSMAVSSAAVLLPSGVNAAAEETSNLHLFILENLLFIILAHFAIYMSSKYPEETRFRISAMASELDTSLQRLNSTLKHKASKAAPGSAASDEAAQQTRVFFQKAEQTTKRFHSSGSER